MNGCGMNVKEIAWIMINRMVKEFDLYVDNVLMNIKLIIWIWNG